MGDKVDPLCKLEENSKAAMNPKEALDPKNLSHQCFDMQMTDMARKIGKSSMSDNIAGSAVFAALSDGDKPPGDSTHNMRKILNSAGIPLEPQRARDITEIPGMTLLPEGEKSKAGDVIIVGPKIGDRRGEQAPGNGMIDVGDGKVVVDNHVVHEPDFSKYEFHRIFRATDSK